MKIYFAMSPNDSSEGKLSNIFALCVIGNVFLSFYFRRVSF